MSLTQDLISLIRAKPVSDSDLDAAALFTLDALANALAGRNTRQGRMLMRWAASQARDAGRLAFVTGGMTHVLETDDLHRNSVTHPGCVVVPAALAVAQREQANGGDFLRAKFRVAVADPWASSYPESWGAQVTVRTADGESVGEARDGARGDPEHALSHAEMKTQAIMLMTFGGCEEDEARRLTDSILKLARAASPVAEFDTLSNMMRAT